MTVFNYGDNNRKNKRYYYLGKNLAHIGKAKEYNVDLCQ